jgi:hypothetical protein
MPFGCGLLGTCWRLAEKNFEKNFASRPNGYAALQRD